MNTLPPPAANLSASNAWMRALELTTPIARNPERTFPIVIEELAAKFGDAPALVSSQEQLTFRGLAERANRYARWALQQGLTKADVVGLLMRNRPEYMAIWLGLSKVGCVIALLNTHLSGSSLAHCIREAGPKHIIVDALLADVLEDVPVTTWVHGQSETAFPRIDLEIEQYSSKAIEVSSVTVEDPALYIYTSGTTGLPKAANVSHGRVMQWTHWFAGMMGTGPSDRMYNCLPMYHSVGGVQAPGATLVGGGTVIIRDKFSASQFWNDVRRWDCTLFQYIGELCRYLLNNPVSAHDAEHGIRMACGNGLSRDVWERFQQRFQISRIFEFYAATEGGVSLFNIEGKSGAIGRIPQYLAHRFSPALVQFDVEKAEPLRDEQGCCVRCAPGEVGEAISPLASNIGSRFEGYTSREASEKRILRDVFKPGDAWVRTGDLMRKDEQGFFYFVDRVGDTFRWKGENVSTLQVSEVISEFPAIQQVSVYGVQISGAEGRAGMAAIVAPNLDLAKFRGHLANRLPHYAHPLFLRIQNDLQVTGTFKYTKTQLAREGYYPSVSTDAFYFNDPERQAFVELDQQLYRRIQGRQVRL